MKRSRKVIIFIGACALALVLTIRHKGVDLSLEANAPLSAAVRQPSAAYDLSQLPVITKALFFVRENYFDKSRFDHKRMLVGGLDFLQRDVPEILIDRYPERDPKQVKVRVGGAEQTFNIERVDSPWSMRSVLQEIFKFVQPNLPPVSGKNEARRLLEVEIAAANGMLQTLDPHSVLLDGESFKEMRTQTQGKFGGLGIVINLDRRGRLFVVRPMPETPAFRAGIKPRDRIVRINNESTMNMTRDEAVERLRGDIGASVDVYIERAGVEGAKKFTIIRDMIRPPAIEPPVRVMTSNQPGQPPAKVGYFRLTQFNANTERDLTEALSLFEKEKVKGIIMDLRGNPGGLYDQAQKVADAFIDSGVLVSMVGVGGSQRKDEQASRNGNIKVPLAVLVNQYSASASEIVAGAVKNLDRGVVIGETTFGKGSVQMLFDIPSPVPSSKNEDERLGLKLTTAQYLTPGDLSIQGVGVTPDIDLVRLRVQKDEDESVIQLQRSNHRRQESDYEWHLDHPSAQKGVKPVETLSYLYVPPPGQEKRASREGDEEITAEEAAEEEDEEVPEENLVDFPMEFARDLLGQARAPRRKELLAQARGFLDRVRVEEDKKLSGALEKLGVDWSQGPASAPAGQVQVSLATVGGGNKVAAGETVKIRGTVKNVGSAPVHRVHALLNSENPYFDENEMVFGKIAPGESKSFDLVVKVAKATLTRTDVIRASVFAQGQLRANTPELTLNVDGKARPLFAYTYQTIDDVKGNQDGRVQLGEKVRLLVKVKNIGPGPALRTEAILRNGPGQQGILISAGRFEARDLAPGATKTFSFVYDVGGEFRGEEYTLELAVGDSVLGESVTDKVKNQGGWHLGGGRGGVGHGDGQPQRCLAARGAGDGLAGAGQGQRRSVVQGHRQGLGQGHRECRWIGRFHPGRTGTWAAGVRGQRRCARRGIAQAGVRAGLAGDAAGAGGECPDRGDRPSGVAEGRRHRRRGGQGPVHPGLQQVVQVAGQEGVLPAEPGRKGQAAVPDRCAPVARVEHHPGVRPGDHRGPERGHPGGLAKGRPQRGGSHQGAGVHRPRHPPGHPEQPLRPVGYPVGEP